jgi:hypothetical protein
MSASEFEGTVISSLIGCFSMLVVGDVELVSVGVPVEAEEAGLVGGAVFVAIGVEVEEVEEVLVVGDEVLRPSAIKVVLLEEDEEVARVFKRCRILEAESLVKPSPN